MHALPWPPTELRAIGWNEVGIRSIRLHAVERPPQRVVGSVLAKISPKIPAICTESVPAAEKCAQARAFSAVARRAAGALSAQIAGIFRLKNSAAFVRTIARSRH